MRFKFFLTAFGSLSALLALIFGFFFPFLKAIFLATLIALIFSLFFSFHLENKVDTESFEITPTNKRHDKGLKEYKNEIDDFLISLRYEKNQDGQKWIYTPRPLYRVMSGNVEIEVTPYLIKVSGSKNMVRILKQLVELDESKGSLS